VIEPDATKISYSGSRPETPTFKLGVTDAHADYAFEIAGESVPPGSTLNLSLPAEGGTLSVQNVGAAGASTIGFKMTRSSQQGVQTFSHPNISLAAGDTAQIQFGNWTATDQPIPLTTLHNGQQSTQTLTNQGP
jgi:hypothetical protein